jgi:MFS family permease
MNSSETRKDIMRTSSPTNGSSNRGIIKDQKSNDIPASKTAISPPYSIFSKPQKMIIVVIASTSAFFSPLSSNIYYPALSIIQEEMRVSSNMINLTITMYMVFQGISPLFWGSVADMIGRRPVFISTFLVYIVACAGLACAKTFATLVALRMLQSFGSSSAIAVGAGTIGKIFIFVCLLYMLLTL